MSWLDYTVAGSILLPPLASLKLKVDDERKAFIPLVIFSALFQMLQAFLSSYGIYDMWMSRIYFPIEFSLIIYALNAITDKSCSAKCISFFGLVLLMIGIIDFGNTFSLPQMNVFAVMLFAVTVFSFLKNIYSDRSTKLLILSLCIYAGGSLPLIVVLNEFNFSYPLILFQIVVLSKNILMSAGIWVNRV